VGGRSRLHQVFFHRADIIYLLPLGAEKSHFVAAGQVTWHEAANFFEGEDRVLGAGDDVQRHERPIWMGR
jgi:hypothetical protein